MNMIFIGTQIEFFVKSQSLGNAKFVICFLDICWLLYTKKVTDLKHPDDIWEIHLVGIWISV